MSKYYVEVPDSGGLNLISGRTVEADYAEVEFGVLKFFSRSAGIVSAFMQWNNFRPEESA
jgi:hypothetical protein